MKKYKIISKDWFNFDKIESKEDLKELFTEECIAKLVKAGHIEEIGFPTSFDDLEEISGFFIDSDSRILPANTYSTTNNANVFPTKEEAEACLALSKLCQLRDVYNEGWKPNYINNSRFYVICFMSDVLSIEERCYTSTVLTFKTEELAITFKNNFKDLIIKAKPLI